jgi:16S rRNA (cytosine1402-N4)-methyltransferase
VIKNPGKSGTTPHIPIMVKEVIQYLQISKTGTYIDCTIGYGGHAHQILKELSLSGKLIGIDKDEEAIKFCKKSLSAYSNVELFQNSYHKIKDILSISKIQKVDGMLLDLGLSSAQLNSKSRGFSFKFDSELDMRFDLSQNFKANDLLNIKSKKEIADIIFKYSEERRSRAIAESILKMRPIKNVFELVEAIRKSTPPKNRNKTLARVFQALRILVNNELSILENFLSEFCSQLSVGGRVVFISFHSLEDRIVKHALKDLSLKKKMKILTKKPLCPSPEENFSNRRSRSAKLRAAERI